MSEYEEVSNKIKASYPKFRILPKSESMFMKFIDKFLYLITFGKMDTFMTNFITTIGYKVYVPSEWDKWSIDSKISILLHEEVHMKQKEKYGSFLFGFLYLFFPLPFGLAYFRCIFEKEAYEVSIREKAKRSGVQTIYGSSYKKFIIENFIGPNYLWMWPFKKSMESWYDSIVDSIANETFKGKKS